MVIEPNDETSFPYKLVLNNTQVSKICKAFANGSLANIKYSKAQFSKMIQLRGLYFFFVDPFLSSNKLDP